MAKKIIAKKEVKEILTPKKHLKREILELEDVIKGIKERTGLANLEVELERKKADFESIK